MEGHASGDGDSGESEGACAKRPQKRSKGKSKVWEKVAWFTRRSRSRDSPSEGVAMADGDTASLPPDHMDMDLSPSNSTSNNSLMTSVGWLESSSSSDIELFEGYQDGSRVKRSRRYPNSEVIEQNCLKPSIARALFLQMDATNHKSGKGPKFVWQKKKKKSHSIPKSDSFQNGAESRSTEDLLSRTMSMPNEIANKTAACHCPACCMCTPAQRLMGACPAHARLSTSTASLDTGLSLSHCAKPTPLAPAQENISSAITTQTVEGTSVCITEIPPPDSITTELPSFIRPTIEVTTDLNQFKSNSLPMYYGKRCKVCNKPTYRPHLPHCDVTIQEGMAVVPGLGLCQCKSNISCTKVTPDAANTQSTETKSHLDNKDHDKIDPIEFRKRTEVSYHIRIICLNRCFTQEISTYI